MTKEELSKKLDAFIQAWKGKKIDFDLAYQGQCVDLFRQYAKDVLGVPQAKGVEGAADFWTNYETDPALKNNYDKLINTETFKPVKGDVMIWNKRAGGGFGHIAVVSDDSATLSNFNSFDQNWRALNVCEITNHTYTNVYGVLRPKITTEMTDLDSCMADRTKFWQERDAALSECKQLREKLEEVQRVIFLLFC